MTQVSPPSYNPRESISIATVPELPTYTLQEEPSARSPTTNSDVFPPAFPAPAPPHATSSPNPSVPKEYSYELKNYWSRPWATLTLLADPRLSRAIPTFLGGSDIDPIKSVVVFVRGDLVTAGDPNEHLNFFHTQKFVWRTSMGDPRAPSASGEEWQEKLHGEYSWPFSVTLPELPAGPDGERFHLPHTLAKRFTTTSIEYYLEMCINRSKFRFDDRYFQHILPVTGSRGTELNDSRIITQFSYFSMQQPSRPSPLRQLAYQDATNVPGPYSDPDGWHALKPVQIRGTVFGERTVDAKCTVFLAKPLCYTRGSSIPCAMTIETDDSQAADVLAAIKSSAVYLQRRITRSFGGSSTNFTPCGQAIWWPSSDTRTPSQRHLMGEVHLRKDLQPSTAIEKFRIQYDIVVFPPAAVAFKPEGSKPLTTQSVEIVTCLAPGVRPRLATPPVYESNDAIASGYFESLADAGPRVGVGIKLWSTG
ncbi:hypothetical protein B0H16DRAFT_1448743 [Mycena metata]|uniref:Arrestin-like N-terminal domain-containing protein n=1 Tax=Mycena metata TaxID=1033252 RepID=A0AAD7K8H5_9AGAR|nr:hypothetical protein B0H16DRAFT_1448743 [Mycena metata]